MRALLARAAPRANRRAARGGHPPGAGRVMISRSAGASLTAWPLAASGERGTREPGRASWRGSRRARIGVPRSEAGVGEAAQAEEIQVPPGAAALEREIGHDLSDHGCEFEAVSAEAGGEGDARRLGMQVQHEVFVG